MFYYLIGLSLTSPKFIFQYYPSLNFGIAYVVSSTPNILLVLLLTELKSLIYGGLISLCCCIFFCNTFVKIFLLLIGPYSATIYYAFVVKKQNLKFRGWCCDAAS